MERTSEHTITYGGGDHGWVSAGIRVTRNSLDYEVVAKKDTFEYEGRCLQALESHVAPTEFIIGPHMIDAVFGLDRVWGKRFRSDAMIFETDHGTWTMKAMAEFKSGRVNHLPTKFAGLSHFLSCLRQEPGYLPAELYRIAGKFCRTPQEIRIPEDQLIRVIVVSRPGAEHAKVRYVPFPMEYLNVA